MSLLYHNDTIIKKGKELLRALLIQFCKLEFGKNSSVSGMGMAEIMKSYPLYTRPLNSGSHTMFHAGYGRGYVDAGPADPFQAETYDGF